MAHPRKGAQSVDLERFIDKRIRVKFAGGREMVGVLKGYDQLVNMVLDDTVEYLRGASASGKSRDCSLQARQHDIIVHALLQIRYSSPLLPNMQMQATLLRRQRRRAPWAW